ncbi:MAG: uncharacterized protein KVP18_003467 [Porospora cf. gigantea A]|uniref:uncharacterized protein n=1 Tax=Porospora cf. gigantea A TaxID=2853593 RepID=UPI003559E5B6|nr:MAG: hypothetical protein KVP18_003467 [Porospora cf. gigantea A]
MQWFNELSERSEVSLNSSTDHSSQADPPLYCVGFRDPNSEASGLASAKDESQNRNSITPLQPGLSQSRSKPPKPYRMISIDAKQRVQRGVHESSNSSPEPVSIKTKSDVLPKGVSVKPTRRAPRQRSSSTNQKHRTTGAKGIKVPVCTSVDDTDRHVDRGNPVVLGPLFFPVGSTGLAYLLSHERRQHTDIKIAFIPLCPECLTCLRCNPGAISSLRKRRVCERCHTEVGDSQVDLSMIDPMLHKMRWDEEMSRSAEPRGKAVQKVLTRFGVAVMFPQSKAVLAKVLELILAEALISRRESLMKTAHDLRQQCIQSGDADRWAAAKARYESKWNEEKADLTKVFELRKRRLLMSRSGPRDDFTDSENLRALVHYLGLSHGDCACKVILPKLHEKLVESARMERRRLERKVRRERYDGLRPDFQGQSSGFGTEFDRTIH